MLASIDVFRHHTVVGSIKEDLSKKFDRLSLGHVRVGLDEYPIVPFEEHVEVDIQELSNELFVLRKDFLVERQ